MDSFQSLTHELGDAAEREQREGEGFGQEENGGQDHHLHRGQRPDNRAEDGKSSSSSAYHFRRRKKLNILKTYCFSSMLFTEQHQ